jgi:hypothetical protein
LKPVRHIRFPIDYGIVDVVAACDVFERGIDLSPSGESKGSVDDKLCVSMCEAQASEDRECNESN